MTKHDNGPQQIGDLLAQAQAKTALPPQKRQPKTTPAGIILAEADQKLIEAGVEIANPRQA